MAEITVPVKLQIQNLQSLVNDLQSKLGNLKVGSSGFKAIQNTITAIRGEIDKLSIQTGKPFIDASQFSKAERSVEKLEDDIEKVSLVMSRLKFSDLELTNEQKADIKAFEDQLSSIKDKLRVVKNTAKDEFLNSEMGQNWLKIDETAFSKSLSQITNNIRKAVADQNAELNKLEQTALDYQHALTENNRIKEFISKNNGDPLSQASLGDMYDKIFMTTAKGQFRYTNNGRNLLSDWLEQQLHLDDSVIAQIINKNVSAANVAGKLKEVLQSQMQQNQTVVDNNPNITAQVDAANAKYQELIAILRQVGVSEDAVTQAEAALRAAFTSTTGEFNAYKEKLVQIAQGNTDVQSTTGMMKSQLESLRTTLQQTNGQFIQMQRTQQSFNQMKMAVVNFMGFNQVLNLTKNAIRNAINHIKELDSVMNKISIVTDMSTGDLWNQVDAYSKMAQAYGVSIKGAYEVSQIYYQQGLQTKDVLTLTNETLKLAKISGLDYATTTDYMTTALRGFKMEMTDAARVVDVYSNLAAHTAVSQEELAVAMSKTASSMESVGATFEEASAMIGTMVAVTRESATNIGSAMKSIASRYGELTKDPTKLVDEEGEAMAFNKVDAALQSVGISMKTVDGQFREFTDVIVELGEKWSELDSTQQRYIATQFAGNRQQSRFLALVSNVDLLKSNLDVAMNSEDTGTLQALKALDSIESKTEQVRVAYQQFYTTIGAENIWKGFLDGAKNVINTLNSFPKLFGKIPVGAIAAIASIINVIKTLGTKVITSIAEIFGQGLLSGFSSASGTATAEAEGLFGLMINAIKGKLGVAKDTGRQIGEAAIQGTKEGATAASKESANLTPAAQNKFNANQSAINTLSPITDDIQARAAAVSLLNEGKISLAQYGQISREGAAAIKEVTNALQEENTALIENGKQADTSGAKTEGFFKKHASQIGTSLQSFGSALHMVAMMIDTTKEGGKTLSGTFMSIGGAVTLAGVAIQAFNHTLKSIPWMAIISGAFALFNGISTLIVTPEERLEELEKKAEELSNKAKEEKANYRTLETSIKKLDELKEKRYESAEAAEEYQTAVDELAEKFPQMIAGFDEAGNVILNTTNSEQVLADARKAARDATYAAAKADLERAQQQVSIARAAVKNSSLGTLGQGAFAGGTFSAEIQKIQQGIGVTTPAELSQLLEHQETALEQLYLSYQTAIENGQTGLVNEYGFLAAPTHGSRAPTVEEFQAAYLAKDTHSATEEQLYNLLFGTDAGFKIETRYNDAVLKFNTLISDETSSVDEVMTAYNEALNLVTVAKKSNNFDAEQIKAVEASFSEMSIKLANWSEQQGALEGYEKLVTSAWQQSVEADTQAWKYLENSATAAAIVTQQIINAKNNTEVEYTDEIGRNYQRTMATFIQSLSPERLDLFNAMTADTANYSAQDIITEFGLENNPIEQYIIDYYKEGATSIQTRLNAIFAKSLEKTANADGTYKQLTEEELENASEFQQEFFKVIQDQFLTTTNETYLNKILKQYQGLIEEGYINRAENYGIAALQLYKEIEKAPIEIQKTLWNSINTNGLATYEGLQQIKTDIENANKNLSSDQQISTESIDELGKTIIPNINLSIQTATSELLETWEDTSKDLTKALSGGVSLKEADALIQKASALGLSLSLDDFQLEGDKLILVSTAFNEYYAELTKANQLAADKWLEKINIANGWLTDFQKGNIFISKMSTTEWEQMRADLQAVGFDYDSWTTAEGTLSEEGLIELQKVITKNRTDLNNYNKAAQIAADQLLNAHERSKGIYKIDGILQSIDALKTIASSTDLTKDQITERAIKEQINSVYDTLISDVLSKGFENINLDDYEGLIASDTNVLKAAIEAGNYKDFIVQYAILAGKSIDETNDLILQAIDKQNEARAEDLISNLTFISDKQFRVDHTELGKLANAFDVPLSKLLDSTAVFFDETLNEYVVDIEKLSQEGIDITGIDNFKITVQESIDALFSSLSSDISNALKGSLDIKGSKNLTDNLRRLNLDANLAFTRTKNGLQLSVAETVKLYNELNKVDSLAAQIVLDELNASIEDSITGMKELKGEMREIAELRTTTESDDFKFMSKNIPSGQNNPLNYWGDMYKGVNTLINAVKTPGVDRGKIDYQDFYNIITEFGHLADQTGELKISGDTILHNSQEAADLIEAGARALTVTSDGSLKVDLSKIGIDFATGADEMTTSVNAGIDKVAQAQIDMLDSMIQMLETIVAMEALGDIDVDQNGIFGLGDIFKSFKDEEGNIEYINEFTEQWKNAIDELAATDPESDLGKALDAMQINGHSMRELFKTGADELDKVGLSMESYGSIMTSLIAMAQSGNFNLDNIMASIKEILAGTGFEGNIDIGDMHLTFHQGIAFERDDKNNYIVDGHSYTDIKDAKKAYMLYQAGVEKGEKPFTVETDGTMQGTLQLGQQEITVIASEDDVKYKKGDYESNTLDGLLEKMFQDSEIGANLSNTETGYYEAFKEWKIEQGITVVPTLEDINNIQLDSTQVKNLMNTTAEQLNSEWETLGDIQFKVKYGFDLSATNGTITPEQLATIKELNGIEGNNIEEKVGIAFEDGSKSIYEWLSNPEHELTIKVNTVKGDTQETDLLDNLTDNNTLEPVTQENKVTTTIEKKRIDNVIDKSQMAINDALDTSKSVENTIVSAQETAIQAQETADSVTHSIENAEETAAKAEELIISTEELIDSIDKSLEAANKAIDGKIESKESTTTPEVKRSYETTQDFTNAVEQNANLIETDGEHFTYAITADAVVDFSQVTMPEGWQFDAANQTLSTTASYYIPAELQPEVPPDLVIEDIDPLELGLDTSEADTQLNDLNEKITEENIKPIDIDDTAAQTTINALNVAAAQSVTKTVYIQEIATNTEAKGNINTALNKFTSATGNLALATGRNTLMGELGPELVVSNGRYFVAGQNGPEMINLADDAIVFNHLQTKSLLEKGMSSGRGKAVTNERNAVSFATGNVNGGPAMASASAALAALKQLRAQWQALQGLSAKDLAGKGGGGGGGGGDPKAFVKELEKWYNWLQEIAQLEKEITLEESKRQKYQSSMIAMGREYAASQLDTLKKLKQQQAVQLSLNRAQSAYFEKRRKDLNENSAFKALYQFDENGQLKYKDGKLEQLSDLVGRDAVTGEANYTAKEQYEKLVEMGYAEQMMYDSSGNEIKQEGDDWYNTAIQAFWDKIDAEREEMQSLHDDVLDGENKLYELSAEQNQILHEIEDNQITVEQKVLKSIEDIRQQQIDDLQDEKDAIEKSSKSLIDGLSNQLQKEQDMRSKQQNSDELTTLQRRLAILQRSGGSAAQIASLQKEISSKQEDAYFDAQQAQIDALQEATDNQLEKLQQQIDLMTEQLAYEKENGLLWQQVYEVMGKSPEEIAAFIMENTKEYFGKSPTELTKETRDTLVEAQKFVEYREQVTGGLQELIDQNSDEAISELSDEITAEADATNTAEETSDTNVSNTNTSTGTTTGSSEVTGYYYKSAGEQGHYLMAILANGSQQQKGGLEQHTFSGNKCTKCYYEKPAQENKQVPHNYKNLYENEIPMAGGGLVIKPTHALIGETGKPEAVLNPTQTAILRNEILSNKPTSLLSLLTDFRDAYNSIPSASSYSSIGTSAGVIIENATVEMNVARIDNDYDAQRAGEQALDRMLQIARKTQGSNRIGR